MTEKKDSYTVEELMNMPLVEVIKLAMGDGVRELSITDGENLFRDVEVASPNVATSQQKTPTVAEYQRQLAAGGGWTPSRRAIESAMSIAKHVRLDLIAMRYRTWCATNKREPRSDEWLMWVTRDEGEATALEAKQDAESRKARPWYKVAD